MFSLFLQKLYHVLPEKSRTARHQNNLAPFFHSSLLLYSATQWHKHGCLFQIIYEADYCHVRGTYTTVLCFFNGKVHALERSVGHKPRKASTVQSRQWILAQMIVKAVFVCFLFFFFLRRKMATCVWINFISKRLKTQGGELSLINISWGIHQPFLLSVFLARIAASVALAGWCRGLHGHPGLAQHLTL